MMVKINKKLKKKNFCTYIYILCQDSAAVTVKNSIKLAQQKKQVTNSTKAKAFVSVHFLLQDTS